MATKKVLFVVASSGYQSIEYGVPKKLLEQAGFTVLTASNMPGTAVAKDESTTPVDLVLSDIVVADYDGIIFIGGPGALEHLDNEISYAIINNAAEAQKPLGAICVATRILARAGVLKDKQATGWNGDNELGALYKKHGVYYVPKDVVQDDTIVTATGPDAAREFAEHIITMLQEEEGEW